MKTTPVVILAGILLGLMCSLSALAQPLCGFDAMHARKIKEDPQYRKNVQAVETSIHSWLQLHPGGLLKNTPKKAVTGGSPIHTLGGPPYMIPVVVHVINTGGAIGTIYNPADAQILGALDYLNAVYNGTYPGTAGAGNLGIQFVLAQRDPNCNPTNGINRVDGSGVAGYVAGGVNSSTTLGTNEINIKNLSRWDNTQYYNIWIVNKIDGNDGTQGQFIAGYAYFPGAPATLDGIVMLATQMVSGQKTLPHEMGHAFNLYHPFQGSTDASQCPVNNDCTTDGDQVCDTDPISENINSATGVVDFTCRSGTNSCTGTPYSDFTESNYMNYTSCYTLFTPGQAARMQASAIGTYRMGLTTSLGGTPPSAGGCAPKIDFELTGDQQTETTAATTGCRSYKDYSYNMVIGVGPSATATVTLAVNSGNAIQGLDFDLTTNGSFSSPSQQLSFPAGSTTSEPFTIRIYDDASVNGTRSFTLGFTVNNGGGNAIAGDGRPAFTMTIHDNDKAPYGPTAVTDTIGPDQGALQSPFFASNPQSTAQILYYASELTAQGIKAGNITALAFDIYKLSGAGFTYPGLTIKLGTTAQNAAYNGSTTSDAGFTTVYNSNYITTNGWNNFTFSTPFTWDGVSNIIVQICYNNGATAGTTDNIEGYVDGSGQTNYILSAVPCGSALGGLSGYGGGTKPIIRFVYADPGTTVQSTLNSSQSQYLGPNADIYFYDQTNGELMARIQNLTSFDYGCTQLIIDRAGTNATQFWNTNTPNYLMDKSFHVLPTTNNASGSYNITLYYTQAETSGWQTFTGQSLSAIQLVKVPGQISEVTAASPGGAGAITQVTPAIGSLGTNTTLTYNFTNGFSGFGAGVPGISPLPVGLTRFTGQLQNNNAVLSWSTSFEQNSKSFEVDRSFDGMTFSAIGNVPAAGNSTSTLNYSFTDPALTHDTNYYRLKQIDLDEHFTYSQVVLITTRPNPGFTVLPNPFTNDLDIVFGQTQTGKVQIRLLDITGRELLRQQGMQSAGSRLHLDFSGSSLSAGVYLLEVSTDNGTRVQKVLKK